MDNNIIKIVKEIRRTYDRTVEQFYIIPVFQNGDFSIQLYAEGDGVHVSGLVIDEILKEIRRTGCSHFLIAHNHPNTDVPIASHADIATTRKLYTQAQKYNLTLLDHLIITETRFMSFKNDGLLFAFSPHKENILNDLEIID